MVDIEMPHEEYTKTYCPRLCPFKDKYFSTPCILKDDLEEPIIVEGRNFNCDKDCEYTAKEIKEHAEQFLNPLQKVMSVTMQPGFVQIYFSHRCCPLWAMREVYGDEWEKWFTKDVTIENGVATYPLLDPLLDLQEEVKKKLKEKKVKNND